MKKKKNIFLSVCIPTYNREEKLKQQLERINNNFSNKKISSDIEIVVCDNNSSDLTEKFCKSFAKTNPPFKFKYIRRKNNYGASNNYVHSILNASGEYAWIVSDDDKIHRGAIEYVYESLKHNPEAAYAFVNYFLEDLEDGQSYIAIPSERKNYIIYSFDSFINKTMFFGFSLISSSCFKRSFLSEESLEKHIRNHSQFPQLYWVSDIVKENPSLIITKPLITMIHPGVMVTRGYGKSREDLPFDPYMIGHLNVLNFHSHIQKYDLSLKTRFKLYRAISHENLNQIIFHKKTVQKYDVKAIRTAIPVMIRKFYLNPFLWVLHLPVLILPSIVAKKIEPLRWKYLNIRAKLGAPIKKCIGSLKRITQKTR